MKVKNEHAEPYDYAKEMDELESFQQFRPRMRCPAWHARQESYTPIQGFFTIRMWPV
jgi:hypothetical protein